MVGFKIGLPELRKQVAEGRNISFAALLTGFVVGGFLRIGNRAQGDKCLRHDLGPISSSAIEAVCALGPTTVFRFLRPLNPALCIGT